MSIPKLLTAEKFLPNIAFEGKWNQMVEVDFKILVII